jgi:hypothetical protein
VQANEADEDLAFVNITVCVPGSTVCQNIDHVQVDTGSEGLRIPAQVLTLSLPQQTSGGNAVSECVGFADQSFIWGPILTADIQIAGEVAKSVPIQITSNATPPSAASNAGCKTGQTEIVTAADLGANAILGVGVFRQDCGPGCAQNVNNDQYFSCPSTGCLPITEPLVAQLQNPVWMFPQDNNGIIVQLPAVPASGQANVTGGNLIFGIGTQADNAVGTAVALQPDTSTGNIGAQFNNVTYNDCPFPNCGPGHGSSFIDSGSNGIFFLDSQTLVNEGFPIPDCSSIQGFYCPASTQQLTVNLFSENSATGTIIGSPRPVQFSVANAQTLFNTGFAAFNNVGGPNPNSFDLGLPFFFGQKVFFGIEGQSTPLGTGPIYAF